MKLNIKLVLLLIVFQSLFFSCHKAEEWKPSHPRLISIDNKMNISDAEHAKISFTVDFIDEADGERVSSFEWHIVYDGQKTLIDKAEKSEFVKHAESGLPSVTFNWSYLNILEKLGVDAKEINDYSTISFIGTLKRDDGFVYTNLDYDYIDPYDIGYEGFYYFEADLSCKNDFPEMVHEATTSCGLTFEGDVEWTSNNRVSFSLENNKGLADIVKQCYIGNHQIDDSFSLSIQNHCDKLSLELNQWGYSIKIIKLDVYESTIDIHWILIGDCYDLGEGKTSWTRLDGKDWSLDLYID